MNTPSFNNFFSAVDSEVNRICDAIVSSFALQTSFRVLHLESRENQRSRAYKP